MTEIKKETKMVEEIKAEGKEIKKSQKSTKKEEIKEISFLEKLNSEEMKNSNFKEIHDKYSKSEEISMINSIEAIKIGKKTLKEIIESEKDFNEKYEFIMITQESRKTYYLFLFDKKSNKEIFIMKNNSIMKNKIYVLKFSQFFSIDSIKINYIKSGRKNQSKEIIDRNSKEYQEKLLKYSMI